MSTKESVFSFTKTLRKKITDMSNISDPVSRINWMVSGQDDLILQDDLLVCLDQVEYRVLHGMAVKILREKYDVRITDRLERVTPYKEWRIPIGFLRDCWLWATHSKKLLGLSLKKAFYIDIQRGVKHTVRINKSFDLRVPAFISESILYIMQYGLKQDELFVRGGDADRWLELLLEVEENRCLSLTTDSDTLEVAFLLKLYLQCMPEGLFTEGLEYQFVQSRDFVESMRVDYLRQLIVVMPRINREVLFLLLSLLHQVSRAPGNGIDSMQLNDIFTIVLFRDKDIVLNEGWFVIKDLIDFYPSLFLLDGLTLDQMYLKMGDTPELATCMLRRLNQCYCDYTDIRSTLRIIYGKHLSYKFATTHVHYHFADERKDLQAPAQCAVGYHRLWHALMRPFGRRVPRVRVRPEELDDDNFIEEFDMAEFVPSTIPGQFDE